MPMGGQQGMNRPMMNPGNNQATYMANRMPQQPGRMPMQQGMMGQQNQMQGVRPGSYVANNQQRMPSPMSTGMGSPQHQPIQQRQPYPQQHQPMPNQNPQQPQQAPMSTPSILSSSLSGNTTQ